LIKTDLVPHHPEKGYLKNMLHIRSTKKFKICFSNNLFLLPKSCSKKKIRVSDLFFALLFIPKQTCKLRRLASTRPFRLPPPTKVAGHTPPTLTAFVVHVPHPRQVPFLSPIPPTT